MTRIILLSLAVVAVGISMKVADARRNFGDKKMVCYVGTWAMYRPGDGKFAMEDIDPELCTHIMYGFAKLENNQLTIFDPWGDDKDQWGGGLDGYRRFTGLKKKNPKLKALIAIGGWNEGSTKYSEMAANPSSRRTFVRSVVPFLEKYNFDGLDLDWEYPTQRGGKPEDKENFSLLVKELRAELDRKNKQYLLTAAVSPNIKTVDMSYDVPKIAKDLDFISVMCYDYHGFWDGHDFTGHNTPLYKHPQDDTFEPFFNANDTVTFWLQAGLPKEKLIMGMAMYGRGFALKNSEQNGLYAPISGGIPEGPYTRQDGIWGYNEICEKFQGEMSQWKISIDSHVMAPFAFTDKHWIGYEDVESIYYKAEYARNMNLGGAMVWSLETDDFRGKCHGEKYILLKTIVDTMMGGGMPEIPERPEVVPADESYPATPGSSSPGQSPTSSPVSDSGNGKPSRRTTTPLDYYVDEDETTPRPTRPTRPTRTTTRPGGKPSATRSTTPLDYDADDDESTTTRRPRPTRTTARPRPSGKPSGTRSTTPLDYEEDDDATTTTRRPRPTRTTARPRPSGKPSGTRSTTPLDYEEDDDATTTTKRTKRTTTRAPERPPQPSGDDGECREEGIFPAGNCSGFYQCVRATNGFIKYNQNCPPGTAFNSAIKGCDHASQVPGCGLLVRSAISYRQGGQ